MSDMTNALLAKNKMGFVDGSLSKPATDSANLSHWMRCDAMVKGWLKSAMDKSVRSSVRYDCTAREIWVDLQERFGKGSAPRAYELRQQVTFLQQEKMSVASFYTKLKGLWDEIQSISPLPVCSCDGCSCDIQKQLKVMREKEQLYDFLMGLDESFGTVRNQILSTTPLPSLSSVYHLVAENEHRMNITANRRPNVEAAAFQTAANRKSSVDVAALQTQT